MGRGNANVSARRRRTSDRAGCCALRLQLGPIAATVEQCQAMRNFKLMAQGEDASDITPTAPDDPERKGSRHVR